jgi:hypothetical protein
MRCYTCGLKFTCTRKSCYTKDSEEYCTCPMCYGIDLYESWYKEGCWSSLTKKELDMMKVIKTL